MTNEICIVGAGPVCYSICMALRDSGYKGKIKAFNIPKKTSTYSSQNSFYKASPKTIQPEFIDASKPLENYLNPRRHAFNYIPVAGIGGGVNFWGASIAKFSKTAIKKNSLNYPKYSLNIKKILSFINYSGFEDDGFSKEYDVMQFKPSLKASPRIEKLFKKSAIINIAAPKLAVDKSLCTLCGNCFDPCKTNAIWHLKRKDFIALGVEVFDKEISYVKRINNNFILMNSENQIIQKTKFLALAANVASNFKLLSYFSNIKKASFFSTASFSFAFPTSEKIPDKLFGMANATFNIKANQNKSISFGNLYDGHCLNIPKRFIFSQFFLLDWFLKKISSRLVIGAGFLDSNNINTTISYEDNEISFETKFSSSYNANISKVKKILKSNFKKNYLPFIFMPGKAGSDIHYAGGIPLDMKVNPNTGAVQGFSGLFVAGGSNFKYLPPESPTLSFMANGYGVGLHISKCLK